MESIPEGFLKIRPGALEAVRRDVNLDKPGEMKEAVRILDVWVKQQLHFKNKDIPLRYLETTIVACKGSVDRAKLSLDKLCTIRTLAPQEFQPFDVKKEFEILNGTDFLLPLPKQTEDHKRVIFIKPSTFSGPALNLLYKITYVVTDYLRMHDYHGGINMICDLTECDIMDALKNINFNDFKNCYQILMESFKARINRIDTVTSSKLIETLLNIIKPFLKKKTIDRITVLKTVEELHQHYPKEILPKEYGGNEKTLRELQDEYLDELSTKEHKEFMWNMYETRTDETLRSQYQFNEMYAGSVGTFRALSID